MTKKLKGRPPANPGYVWNPGTSKYIKVTNVLNEPVRRKPVKQRGVTFVKLPTFWIERLAGQKSARAYELAHLLLVLGFKGRGGQVRLSNEAVQHLEMDRQTKRKTLLRLETLGLISVERKATAAPLITIKLEL
jgi:hypothetical protein